MKILLFNVATAILLCVIPGINSAQIQPPPPVLGTADSFAVFTSVGALTNDGATSVTGDVGSDVGGVTGFPPGVVFGSIHDADATSAAAAPDVCDAYAYLDGILGGTTIGTTLGSGQTLTPDVYILGAASTLNGELVLDAQGDPDAIFIFQIDGALSTTVGSMVTLINGGVYCNVYWQINGAVTLGEGSVFRGTILASGAIHVLEAASLFGRALTCAGAIDLHNNIITNGYPIASIITAGGATTFCAGGSVTLSGNVDGTWSTGATTESIIVTEIGDYFVTNTDECGEVNSNVIQVVVNPLPLCSITGDSVLCEGDSSELCTPFVTGNSYLWSTGEVTNCITVDQEGLYTVTVTDENGCSSVCSETVVVNPPPLCSITGDSVLCEGKSSELCTPFVTGNTYLWSTGEVTNCIMVDQAGLYTVTVTDENGCSSVCSETVVVNPLPLCSITGDSVLCEGDSSELCTPFITGNSYLWSTGEVTNCITVDQEGLYTVTVTDENGCSSVCDVTVVVNPPPICTITGNAILCEGESTELCVPPGAASYLWSTGEINSCITVDQPGLYSVTVTYSGGCSSVCSETVVVNPLPLCSIAGDSVFCEGESSELCTPFVTGNTYLWSTGEFTNCITVNQEGLYTVTVTDENGCSSVCSKTVIVNPPPLCSITGDSVLCEGESSELCTPFVTGNSYLWSTGEFTNCITVDQEGLYTVTVTDENGCSSICSKTVVINPPPLCSITGDSVLCEGESSELCTPFVTSNSYLWSTGDVTNCITVDQEELYTVTVTDENGCSSVCSKTVIVNPLPTCTITGNAILCEGESTELCVTPGAASYLWNTGDTTMCITASLAGTYSVTITDVNGCSSTCSLVVIVTPPTPPVITCPENVTIECNESTLPTNTGTATATNSCGLPSTITFSDSVVTGLCPQESTITRTWTATVSPGISSTCTQSITILDNTLPVIICPPDISIECNESMLPSNTGIATATDNCDLSPVVSFSDILIPGECPDDYLIERTWLAIDNCSNSAICVQLITVSNNTPPVITIVNPLLAANGDTTYIQCYGQDPEWDLPQFDENSVEVTGICEGTVTVDYSQTLQAEGDCDEDGYIMLYRLTWTATDLCGNSSSAFVFLALVDTIAPVIYGVPSDTTVNCDAIPDLPALVYAEDECLCACIVLLQESELPPGCQNGGVLLRSWTARDQCGNETVVTQRITLLDNEGPLLVIIEPELVGMQDGTILEYACSEGGIPDFMGLMSAQSVLSAATCGSTPLITFNVITLEANNCEFSGYVEQHTYQWIAVDECGNETTMTIIARLIDNEPPELMDVPEITCIGDPALKDIYAIDNCTQASTHFWDVTIPNPCGIGMAIKRTYEAFDDCGNISRDTAILIPNDQQSPTLEFATPMLTDLASGEILVVNCTSHDGKYTSFGIDDVNFSDACDMGVTTTFTETLLETGDCVTGEPVAVVELEWTATDICGNYGVLTLIAHVTDESSPAFVNFHPEVTIGCRDPLPSYVATDNCSDVSFTTRDSIIHSDCAYEYVIHRIVTATDYCGNSIARPQIIHVGDGRGPVIEGVKEKVCDDLTIPVVTAYDACSGTYVEVTMEQDTLDVPCRNGLVIVRTWTAIDICGNMTVIHQTIIMHDQTPPEILIPFSSVINYLLDNDNELIFLSQTELMHQINLLDENSVFVSDGCDQDITPVLTVDVLPGDCKEDGFSEHRVYTWVVTDDCGNSTSFSVTVDIIDDVPPVMHVVPADTMIVCVELPAPQEMLVDTLDNVTIVYTEVILPGDQPNEFIVTRTWVSTDSCGNESVVIQRITWIPDSYIVCEILVPPSIVCNSHGVIIGSIVTDGTEPYTYEWQVVGENCFIQGGQGTPELEIYVGWEDAKIILTITDTFGCVSMCMVVLHCDLSQLSQLSLSDDPLESEISPEYPGSFVDFKLNSEPEEGLTQLKSWPNPTSGNIRLSFESAIDQQVKITLVNSLGQDVMNEQFQAFRGLNTRTVNLEQHLPGSYMIQVNTEKEIHTKVIVVLRRN